MLDKLRSNFNGGFFFLGLVNGLKIRDDKIQALQLRVWLRFAYFVKIEVFFIKNTIDKNKN